MLTDVSTAPPRSHRQRSSERSAGFREDVAFLRGLAIILVVTGHALAQAGSGFKLHGGVDMSFAISGFLVSWLLLKEFSARGRIDFPRFYASRARRLLPPVVVTIALTLLGAWLFASPLRLRATGWDAIASTLSFMNWRLAGQQADYHSSKEPSFFLHFWSLSIEEQYYLVWPLLILAALWLGRRFGFGRLPVAVVLSVMTGVSLMLSIVITQSSQPWAYFGLHTRAWELAAGALVALAARRLAYLPRSAALMLMVAGMALIMYSAVTIAKVTLPGYAVAGPVVGTLLVIAGGCALPGARLPGVFRFAPVQYLGKVSYSWYLLHWPLLLLMPEALNRRLSGYEIVAVAGASLALAAVMYHALEVPVRRHKQFVTVPRTGLWLGVQCLAVCAALAGTMFYIAPSGSSKGQQAGNIPAGDVQRAVAEAVNAKALSPEARAALPTVLKTDGQIKCITATRLVKPDPCTMGQADSPRTIVLLGDSHALQWTWALDALGKKRGFKLMVFTKVLCVPEPYMYRNESLGRDYTECETWRENALQQIEAMRPETVLITSAMRPGANGDATRRLFERVRSFGAKAALLEDTPGPKTDIPVCLSNYPDDATRCGNPYRSAVPMPGPRKERQDAAVGAGALWVPVMDLFCTQDFCPAYINGIVVYIDGSHVSRTYVLWLMDELEKRLTSLI